MANKRIELEQCKYYINLQQEYPDRKTVHHGIMIALITCILFVFGFFVLGMLSGNLATNPKNVLELPPEQPAETMPEGFDMPEDMEMPEGFDMPEGMEMNEGVELPEGVPRIPSPEESESPDSGGLTGPALCDAGTPGGTAFSEALLAQAEPVPDPTTFEPEITIPPQDGSAPTSPEAEGEEEVKGPGQQTTGVGNLANLANSMGGRGFQLYLLVVTIVLMVIMYLPVRQVRFERKQRK